MKQYIRSFGSQKLLMILLLIFSTDLIFLNYKALSPTVVYKEVKIGDSKDEVIIEKEDLIISSPSSKTSFVKKFYIPLGTGVNQTDEWVDVPGLEASIHVPTGNQTADVRLFNSTKGHAVWDSEMTFTGGGAPQLLISKPITLDSGSNLAYLDQARVRITTY